VLLKFASAAAWALIQDMTASCARRPASRDAGRQILPGAGCLLPGAAHLGAAANHL